MGKAKRKGFFVSLEGGEGVGKSTLSKALENYFTQSGKSVVVTREPGGTELGECLRDLLLNKRPNVSIGSRAELLMLLAARAQHLQEKILPALEQGSLVICDRFHDSTIAYQGYARGLGVKNVQDLCLMACQGFVPDLTLWLDLSPAEGMARRQLALQQNGQANLESDRFEAEKLDFHSKVYLGLKQMAEQEPQRIIRLDASEPSQSVAQVAIRMIEERLNRE